MSRVTLKSSTIFISVGNRTEVYRSVQDVPPTLRKQLEQSTNGIHSATILIADRKGKEEIVRAVRGLPSSLRARASSALRDEVAADSKAGWRAITECWIELLMPAVIGFGVWLLFSLR